MNHTGSHVPLFGIADGENAGQIHALPATANGPPTSLSSTAAGQHPTALGEGKGGQVYALYPAQKAGDQGVIVARPGPDNSDNSHIFVVQSTGKEGK